MEQIAGYWYFIAGMTILLGIYLAIVIYKGFDNVTLIEDDSYGMSDDEKRCYMDIIEHSPEFYFGDAEDVKRLRMKLFDLEDLRKSEENNNLQIETKMEDVNIDYTRIDGK
jgi:hypothetical protein